MCASTWYVCDFAAGVSPRVYRTLHLYMFYSLSLPPYLSLSMPLSSVCSSVPINVSLISRNISGLHILASCNAWKQVVSLSLELMQGNPLNAYGDDRASLSVVFIFRLIGLFRMKMLDELQQESSAKRGVARALRHLGGGQRSLQQPVRRAAVVRPARMLS